MRAAVLWEPGRLEIADVELAPPRAGEVLVDVAACGPQPAESAAKKSVAISSGR